MNDAFSRFMAALMVALVAIAYIGLSAPLWAAGGCIKVPMKAMAEASKIAGQIPQWSGNGTTEGGRYMILANTKTGQWTAIFLFTKEGTACVLAEGKGSKPEFGEPT